jgi:hypothetical protein
MITRCVSFAFVLAVATVCGWPAFGQSAPQEAMSDTAEKLYDEAEAARQRGDHATCKAKATAAWGVERHPKIAGILGDCELSLGEARSAAEHLHFLSEKAPTDVPAEVLDYFKKRLADARKRVATIRLRVNVADALVTVDDLALTKHDAAVFLDPGEHTFEARSDGYKTARVVRALKAGSDDVIRLDLQPLAPTPRSTNGTHSNSAPDHTATPDRTPSYVMGAIGLAGIAAGVVLFGLAASRESDGDDLEQAIRVEGGACGDALVPSFEARCQEYQDLHDEKRGFLIGGGVATGVGALLLGGAIVYFVTAPASDDSRPAKATLLPVIAEGTLGCGLVGTF